MTARSLLIAFALAFTGTSVVTAQDFGVMESAEILVPGNLKFTAHPMFIFGKGAADDSWGGVLRGGYGFTRTLDAELALALYDGATLFGGNLELGLLQAAPGFRGVDASVFGGVHLVAGDAVDAIGLDLAALYKHLCPPELGIGGDAGLQPVFL